MAKRITRTAEEREQIVVQDYKDAYRRLYGIFPVCTRDGVYIRISGQSAGVTLRRLKTLTTQLNNAHYLILTSPSEATSKQRPAGRAFRL